ncbi:MAG: alpha/beta hydrolase [Clostridia bacterium]|nr:alpha/beta hydrolase [Clostridia bacterium]
MGFIIAGIIIIVVAAALLVFTYITYRIAFYSPKNRKENIYDFPEGSDFASAKQVMTKWIDEVKDRPCEEVEITSFDGLKLRGRYYHIQDGAPIHIQFHGYRGTAFRDFSGGNRMAREMGHNNLLIDQRAHGKSEGRTISFGINERRDCLAWAKYAADRFGENTELYLSGVSMGATTVLMAAGLDLPKNVKGIIADCPFSSPEKIIKKTIKEMGFSLKFAFPFVALGARIFGKFNVREATAQEAVKKARVPILLLHGETDTVVPYEMSREVYESSPEKITFSTFPEAGHAMSYVVDPVRYEKAVKEFFAKTSKFVTKK